MAAVNEGDVEAVAKLLEAGTAFDAIDSDNTYTRGSLSGISALHLAFGDSKRYPAAELLLGHPDFAPTAVACPAKLRFIFF